MQLAPSQHYIIKNKNSIAYYFFLNKDREICFNIYNEDNQLIHKEKLVPHKTIDFSVNISQQDQIHLICITSEGDLLYYIGYENHWNHKILSKLNIQSNTYRYLQLYVINNSIHIFCNKTNLLNATVTSIEHIYFHEKTLHKTTVTSFLPGKYTSPYHIAIDSMNNIHIVYKILYKKNHQLYYSRFNMVNKKWKSSELLTDLEKDHCHPYILIDKMDHLHMVWCTIENNNFILKYKHRMNMNHPKSRWSKTRTLSNQYANCLSPILIQEEGLLKIFSKQNQYICEIISEDHGLNWSPVEKGNLYKTENPLFIKYSSNDKREKENYSCQYVYGEIKEQIYIFGTKLFKTKSSSIFSMEMTPILKEDDQDGHEEIHSEIIRKNNSNCKIDISKFSSPYLMNKMNHDFEKMIEQVQNHINKLVYQIKKLEEANKTFKTNLTDSFKKSIEYPSSEKLYDHLKNLKIQLSIMEEEKFKLQRELDKCQKKMNSIEEIFVEYKKQYCILEDQITQLYTVNTTLMDRIKNFFK